MSIEKKREALVADHKAMEKYDPYWKTLAEKGDRIGDRPVAFLCDDEVVIVGACVAKVTAGLAEFLGRGDEYVDRTAREPAVAQAMSKARKYVDATDEIRVPQQVWNALAFALGEVGLKVVLTDGRN